MFVALPKLSEPYNIHQETTKDSVKGLKQADEEDVKTSDKDLGAPVEKEVESSVTDLLVPAEKYGKDDKAFVEGPTSSELEPGKNIN